MFLNNYYSSHCSYPRYAKVSELPGELDDQLEAANLLYDKGLITVVDPYHDDSCDYGDDDGSDSDSQEYEEVESDD